MAMVIRVESRTDPVTGLTETSSSYEPDPIPDPLMTDRGSVCWMRVFHADPWSIGVFQQWSEDGTRGLVIRSSDGQPMRLGLQNIAFCSKCPIGVEDDDSKISRVLPGVE